MPQPQHNQSQIPAAAGRPAVFLDRDGTVVPDHGYCGNLEGIYLLPGAGEAVAALHQAGYALVLVTNQSGIARGYFEAAMVEAQNAKLQALLEPFGVQFDALRYCPHAKEDGCTCRKPAPGMLLSAADTLGVDPTASWMVGDRDGDAQAGLAAGCRALLVGEPPEPDKPSPPEIHAVPRLPDLVAAVAHILTTDGHRQG